MTTKFKIVGGPGKFELMEAQFCRQPEFPVRVSFKLMAEEETRKFPPDMFLYHRGLKEGEFIVEAVIKGVEASDDTGQSWSLKIEVPQIGNFDAVEKFYPQLFGAERDGSIEFEGVCYSTFSRSGRLVIPSGFDRYIRALGGKMPCFGKRQVLDLLEFVAGGDKALTVKQYSHWSFLITFAVGSMMSLYENVETASDYPIRVYYQKSWAAIRKANGPKEMVDALEDLRLSIKHE